MLGADPYREQSYQTALQICEDLDLQAIGGLVKKALNNYLPRSNF